MTNHLNIDWSTSEEITLTFASSKVIQIPKMLACEIQNPGLWNLLSSLRNSESCYRVKSGMQSVKPRVQDCLGLPHGGQLTYRQLMRKVTTQFSLGWLHVRILITETFCTALLTKATVVLS